MSALAIGKLAAGLLGDGSFTAPSERRSGRSGSVHRTGRPIHRLSKEEGTFEHQFFFPPEKGETDRILRKTRKLLDEGNRLKSQQRRSERALTGAERSITRLTEKIVRVLEELLTSSRLNAGRVYPSYEHLAEKAFVSRETVARAIRVLEDLNLIEKQRRFKMVEGDAGTKNYRQTSNAYRIRFPQSFTRFLPKWMRPSPVPDDAAHRAHEEAQQTEAMLGTASCGQVTAYLFDYDSPLGKAFLSLANGVDDRECQNSTAPRS